MNALQPHSLGTDLDQDKELLKIWLSHFVAVE